MGKPDDSLELLQELCSIHAVSGREDAMVTRLRELLTPLADEIEVDRLGNITGILRGATDPDFTLMLQAHIDEIGLIVRQITPQGFLLIERVGGVPEKSLLGQKVDLLTDEGRLVTGYVASKSHHITTPAEKYVVPKIHEMYVDLGLPDRQSVEALGVQIGDPLTYHPNFLQFGDGMIASKALDNRVSVFVLLETLKELATNRPPCTIVFAFTVLEEFSIRGSLPVINRFQPAAIISLDITVAADTPYSQGLQAVAMRGGPAVKLMDFHGRGTLGGMFSSPKLRRFIEQIAAEHGINLQREVIVGVITDPAFQLYQGEYGQVIAGLSIPQRYTHSSISMCHRDDIFATQKLLISVAKRISPAIDLSRG